MAERVYDDGAIVCRAGDPAEAVFRVRAGALELERTGAGTPTANGHMLLAGEYFGAEALLAGTAYGATARARGRTVLEIADRDAVLKALAERPVAAAPLLRAALDLAGSDPAAPIDTVGRQFRLVPGSPSLVDQMGADGVLIGRFPFVVGRREAHGEQNGARGVDLVLRDRAPYNLSRRHFAIERNGEAYAVRDCGSYHGTIVNGALVGAAEPTRVAVLTLGDNLIVAGKGTSPIRFSFLVA